MSAIVEYLVHGPLIELNRIETIIYFNCNERFPLL